MKIEGVDAITAAAKRIRAVPDASVRAAYRAVNTVAARVVTMAKRDIAAEINLPQSYVAAQTTITKATPASAVGVIRMRMRAVRLARFAATQLTKAAPRARGDAGRGIAARRKQAGVSVKVDRKGGRKRMPGAFMLPLRGGEGSDGGASNGMGVFIRTGKGPKAIRHLYGPSPDQLFRRWRAGAAPDIKRLLFEAYSSQLRYELRGTRK